MWGGLNCFAELNEAVCGVGQVALLNGGGVLYKIKPPLGASDADRFTELNESVHEAERFTECAIVEINKADACKWRLPCGAEQSSL